MRPITTLPALAIVLTLAACATPQQRCINQHTRDLRVVEGLIARLKTDIARGYALVPTPTVMPRWVFCGGPYSDDGPGMCLIDTPATVARPAAFDIAEAKRQLAQLEVKRRELERTASPAVEACRAAFPDKG
ncbi:hypothetical protein U879_15615 [Defluviimonas sp. 20V17]|uniref:Lipoprotein n=1 Tax=Allgaiera indica TaxID=765699 RepID=A0AAN4ZXM4_9RHOB|nr:hypothetical protein [Allgaiera indica]KDB02739.1 hypothetical protein U879_15615 [Defluviimonas sp. 20V17]GHD98699.1 hypothetical protein GCM10008024_03260 [Allgaiera indica]SDW08107.1 hypothetical protein SAMN05444006_101224 [Allgaiera indica]